MTALVHLPILLLEPNALLRQTVALTAISVGVGPVCQASTIKAAKVLLETQPFSGAVVTVDGTDGCHDDALTAIESIRNGMTASSADISVYVVVDACSQSLVARLSSLRVQRVLIKPFKARVLIEALANVSSASARAA
jgi:DNA-binding NarL/FixJ family response regulator